MRAWTSRLLLGLGLVAYLLVAPGHAKADIVSLVGDKDGFGLPGAPAVPADGTLWRDGLGGVFFNDYRTAFDVANAPFTDQWFADANLNYLHTYALAGTPTSATLSIQVAGIADNRGPWDIVFNGVTVGQFPTNTGANGFQEILMYTVNIPTALLTGSDSVNLRINVPGVTDGYSVNFSELNIVTDVTAVPEPSSMALLAFGSVGLVSWRLRRKNRKV